MMQTSEKNSLVLHTGYASVIAEMLGIVCRGETGARYLIDTRDSVIEVIKDYTSLDACVRDICYFPGSTDDIWTIWADLRLWQVDDEVAATGFCDDPTAYALEVVRGVGGQVVTLTWEALKAKPVSRMTGCDECGVGPEDECNDDCTSSRLPRPTPIVTE